MLGEERNLWKHYTPEDREYIRTHDDCTFKTRRLIANYLGRSEDAIRYECGKMGLHKWRRCDWKDSEDKYLREHVGFLSYGAMGKHLKRSMAKVAKRCEFLKIDKDYRDGWFNTTDVAFGFGCTNQHIRDLIYDKKLKAKQDKDDKKDNWVIKREAIYKYITQYPMELEGRNCDMVFIVDILTDGDIKYNSNEGRVRMPDEPKEEDGVEYSEGV